MPQPSEQLAQALRQHAPNFDVEFDEAVVDRLCKYYELLLAWNPRLHLVAPCSVDEFATRHLLESLFALRYINENIQVVDLGSGGGLPIIPCLIARPNIGAVLIESSPKKAVFLREALKQTNSGDRAKVVASRFEEVPAPDAAVVTCRALDQFRAKLPSLFQWSPVASRIILFGGNSLRAEIEKFRVPYSTVLIPESENRFLFVIEKS